MSACVCLYLPCVCEVKQYILPDTPTHEPGIYYTAYCHICLHITFKAMAFMLIVLLTGLRCANVLA